MFDPVVPEIGDPCFTDLDCVNLKHLFFQIGRHDLDIDIYNFVKLELQDRDHVLSFPEVLHTVCLVLGYPKRLTRDIWYRMSQEKQSDIVGRV